jgi:hypothetical protein
LHCKNFECFFHDYGVNLSETSFEALTNYTKDEIIAEKYTSDRDPCIRSFSWAYGYLLKGLSEDTFKYMIHCSAKELKDLSKRAAELHVNLITAALNLAEERGCFNEVMSKSEKLDMWFGKPHTVSRPFHLHYTTHEAGGGDFVNILRKLEFLSDELFRVPDSWIKFNCESSSRSQYQLRVNPLTILNMLENDRFEESCFQTIKIAKMIQAVGLDSADLFLEMTMWKRLPCCMAFHERPGRGSHLASLSQDIMQMVLKFSTE